MDCWTDVFFLAVQSNLLHEPPPPRSILVSYESFGRAERYRRDDGVKVHFGQKPQRQHDWRQRAHDGRRDKAKTRTRTVYTVLSTVYCNSSPFNHGIFCLKVGNSSSVEKSRYRSQSR